MALHAGSGGGVASEASDITIGATTVTGGADTRVLFQDGTTAGENASFTFAKSSGLLSFPALAVTGTANVTGSVTFGSTLNVTGNTGITGTFNSTGAATFGGTVTATGAISGLSTLAITGAANVTGNVGFAGTVNATGAATFLSTIKLALFRVADLPAATTTGQLLFLKDSNTASGAGIGTTVTGTGGGVNQAPVFSNGANWVIL